MTRPHFGIVLVILGTILLAFAVKVRSSRELIVHIVGSSIVATEATISDDPAVAAMGRPRTPCSGLGASVVNIVDNAPATPLLVAALAGVLVNDWWGDHQHYSAGRVPDALTRIRRGECGVKEELAHSPR